LVKVQIDFERVNFRKELHQILQRSAEAIDTPRHDCIELALCRVMAESPAEGDAAHLLPPASLRRSPDHVDRHLKPFTSGAAAATGILDRLVCSERTRPIVFRLSAAAADSHCPATSRKRARGWRGKEQALALALARENSRSCNTDPAFFDSIGPNTTSANVQFAVGCGR
jgi:hypothetical protein